MAVEICGDLYPIDTESLELRDRGPFTIPANVFRLTKLKSLILISNQITEIPAAIGLLTKLEILDLTDNQITQICMEIQFLDHLHTLILKLNHIRALQYELFVIANLEVLDLSFNEIENIYNDAEFCTKLKVLDLSNNCLNKFIVTTQMAYLRQLSLSENFLTEFPENIEYLEQLEEIDVSLNDEVLCIPKLKCRVIE